MVIIPIPCFSSSYYEYFDGLQLLQFNLGNILNSGDNSSLRTSFIAGDSLEELQEIYDQLYPKESLSSGNCDYIDLNMNFDNSQIGVYNGEIQINSNDPEKSIISIPYVVEVIDEIYGCLDNNACNFNSSVTIDDGSCVYPGCTDNNFIEYYNQGYSAGCDDEKLMFYCN